MMKKITLLIAGFIILSPFFAYCNTNTSELTGDAATACKVLLCLPSSVRPEECMPPIAKFFSIKYKKPQDTANARTNFLKLCPTSNDPTVARMIPVLIQQQFICDAKTLNLFIDRQREPVLDNYGHQTYDVNYQPIYETYQRIRPTMPPSCQALANLFEQNKPIYTCTGNYYSSGLWAQGFYYTNINTGGQFMNIPVKPHQTGKDINNSTINNHTNNSVDYDPKDYETVSIRNCWIDGKSN